MRSASLMGGVRRAAFVLYLVGAAAGYAASPALAGTGFVAVPPTAFEVLGTASHAGSYVAMADGGSAVFKVPLIIPPDYKKNTAIKFALNVQNGGAAAGTAVFKPNYLTRARNGKEAQGSTKGLRAAGGNPLVKIPDGYVMARKVFYLKPKGPLKTQLPRDTLIVGIARDGADPSDTCSTNLLMSVEVTYTTK